MKTGGFLFLLLVCFSASASADSWTVNSPRDAVDQTPGDGICSTGVMIGKDPECTLRAAVQEANARVTFPHAHQITVPAGIYLLTHVELDPRVEEEQQRRGLAVSSAAVRSGDLDIDSGLIITGAGPGMTIIDGNATDPGCQSSLPACDRVFDIWRHDARFVALRQLTVRNGMTVGPGGCIAHRGFRTEVQLFMMTVEGCTSDQQIGGGMFSAGFTEMGRVTFSGNTGLRGGGFENGDAARIFDSTFHNNRATVGQGLLGEGGGISNINVQGGPTDMVIRNSTISNNSANIGGGIVNYGWLSLINSTVSGNAASEGSGGIAYFDAPNSDDPAAESLHIAYSTITNNAGVGITRASAGPFSIASSIVSGNGINCDGGHTTSRYNLDSAMSCGFTGTGDLSDTEPLLGPLAFNGGPTQTHALLPGSPAIDAGSPPGVTSEPTDQRGTPRPLGPASDIGAFEFGIDPDMLLVDIAMEWGRFFRPDLIDAIEFQIAFSLPSVTGEPGGTRSARIMGVKAADGQKQLKFELAKDGRSLRVAGVAIPPKAGQPASADGPLLFYVQIQRALKGATVLTIDGAACACGEKPKKVAPIVIPPYQGGK